MNEHETILTLLALASAGGLDAQELARVQRHARECEICQSDLKIWSLYTRGLGQLPQPAVPLGLMERTQMRMLEEHAATAARRANVLLLGALSIFCWVAFLAVWVVVRVLSGGVWNVFGVNLAGLFEWSAFSMVLNWITAGAAAVILANRREIAREVRSLL